jgi:hypothetical protein
VARCVGRLLDRYTGRTGEPGDIESLDIDGNAVAGGKAAAELLVPIRLHTAQLVIQVRRAGKLKSLVACHLAQGEQQGDRVRAPRQGDDDTCIPLKQSVTPDGTSDGIGKR